MKKKSGQNDNRPKATEEDHRKYDEAWSKMMVDIWREKIDRLRVVDTRMLRQQITEKVVASGSELSIIQHNFVMYGIYQDCGVGRGFDIHGKKYKDGHVGYNKGELELMDKDYRKDRGLGEPREPREWFSRSYFISRKVLAEQKAYMYGEDFCAMIVDAVENSFHSRSTSMRSHLWGHHGRTV